MAELMILNVIDKRKKRYRWKRVNAIIESAWHDNGVEDADQAERRDDVEIAYDANESISVAEAIDWASSKEDGVTLFLYDEGCGTSTAKLKRRMLEG